MQRELLAQEEESTVIPDLMPQITAETERFITDLPAEQQLIPTTQGLQGPGLQGLQGLQGPEQPQQAPQQEETDRIVAFEFYINRLMKLDPTLFKYKLVNPKAKHYASTCAANEDRQPLGLSQEQFDHNLEVYKNDPNIAFIVYRDNVKEEDLSREIKQASGKEDVITVVRYGSNPRKPNYYMCAQYYCLKDNLILRPSAFRDNGNRCPFCNGRKIKDKRSPGPDETVLEREPKDPSKPKTLQSYIQFMKISHHPEGLSLPCCFGLKKEIGPTDPGFRAAKEYARGVTTIAYAEEEEQPTAPTGLMIGDTTVGTTVPTKDIVPTTIRFKYYDLRFKIGAEYILGPEKYPLEPEKVGMCNKVLDTYFGQDSSKLVARIRTKQEIKNSIEGFFRVGVFNKPDSIQNSLFAALIPILNVQTIKQVSDIFRERITPKEFMHLNFGNLLLEFFQPGDPGPEDETHLIKWAQNYDIYINERENDCNMYELVRLYKSYHRFMNYLTDPNQRKQLRHVIQFLMEPGLLIPNTPGITPIVLEYKGIASMPNVELEVKCPILGYDPIRHGKNNIAFLTHDAYGFWEPIIFVKREILPNATTLSQIGSYVITKKELDNPRGMLSIVRQRFDEFIGQCRSSYRGIYTAQQGLDSRQILPISMVVRELLTTEYKPVGIVRDIYNHVVALTVGIDVENPGEGREVIIPVVDDGSIDYTTRNLRVYLGFECIKYATAEQVYMMYTKVITPLLAKFNSPFYQVYMFEKSTESNLYYSYILGTDSSDKIRFQCMDNQELTSEFANPGIPIPETMILESDDIIPFDYDTNRDIAISGQDVSSVIDTQGLSVAVVERQKAEEYYEHFRLLFTNWVESMEAGPSVRRIVNAIVEREDVSDLVKRKRLEVMLRPVMERWIYPDDGPFENKTYLTRKDCLGITDPGKCDGVCKWKTDESRCLLHTPRKIPVSSVIQVPIQDVFITRLLDELVRIPYYRRELLYQKVSKIKVPKTNIHVDSEWIIPENVPAWYELLRSEKVIKEFERPRYYEEFSRNPRNTENEDLLQPLPAYAREYFADNAHVGVQTYQVYPETNIQTTASATITIAKLLEVAPAIIKRFGPTWSPNAFTQAQLSMISTKISPSKTLIQITPDGSITIASETRDAKNMAIVFFPDYNGQVGIVYNRDTFSRILQPSVELHPDLNAMIQGQQVLPKPRNRTVQVLHTITQPVTQPVQQTEAVQPAVAQPVTQSVTVQTDKNRALAAAIERQKAAKQVAQQPVTQPVTQPVQQTEALQPAVAQPVTQPVQQTEAVQTDKNRALALAAAIEKRKAAKQAAQQPEPVQPYVAPTGPSAMEKARQHALRLARERAQARQQQAPQ